MQPELEILLGTALMHTVFQKRMASHGTVWSEKAKTEHLFFFLPQILEVLYIILFRLQVQYLLVEKSDVLEW